VILVVDLALQLGGTSSSKKSIIVGGDTSIVCGINGAHGQTVGLLGAIRICGGVADVAASSVVGEDLGVALGAGAGGTGATGHTTAAIGGAQGTPASSDGVTILQAGDTLGIGGMTGDGSLHTRGILGALQGSAGVTGQALSFSRKSTEFIALAALAGVQLIALLPFLQTRAVLATGTTHQFQATIPGILGETVVIRSVGQTSLGLAARTAGIRTGVATQTIRGIREGITVRSRAGGTIGATSIRSTVRAIVQLLVIHTGSNQILAIQGHQTLTLAAAFAQVRLRGIQDTAGLVGRIAEGTGDKLLRGPGIVALIRLAGEAQGGVLPAVSILVVIDIIRAASPPHRDAIRFEDGLTILILVQCAGYSRSQGTQTMFTHAGVTLQRQVLVHSMLTIINPVGQIDGIALASRATAAIAEVTGIALQVAAACTGGNISGKQGLAGLRFTDPRTGQGVRGIRLTTGIIGGGAGIAHLTISREDLKRGETFNILRSLYRVLFDKLTSRLHPSMEHTEQLASFPSRQAANSDWPRSYRQPRLVEPSDGRDMTEIC